MAGFVRQRQHRIIANGHLRAAPTEAGMPDMGAFRRFSALEAEPRQTTHHGCSNASRPDVTDPGPLFDHGSPQQWAGGSLRRRTYGLQARPSGVLTRIVSQWFSARYTRGGRSEETVGASVWIVRRDKSAGRCKTDQRGRAAPAATASISISNAGLTSALTMIVAEPGRASPKCLARAAPAATTSSERTR